MGSRLEKNSQAVRKRIEGHTFSDEAGEEYEPSAFGGFGDYFRRKKIKLQNLDSELRASASSAKPQIFKGVVAHVTGYTQPPLHILHHDLVQHGAGFLQYLDSKTMATHIITSSLPPKKMLEFAKYRIVRPAWVTDSIQEGKLLPWSDYRVINEETPRQKLIKFDQGKMSTQANSPASPLAAYKEQTNNSFYTSQLRHIAQAIDGAHAGDESPSQRVASEVKGELEDIDEDDLIMEMEADESTRFPIDPEGAAVTPILEATSPATVPAPGERSSSLDVDNRSAEHLVSDEGMVAPKALTSEEHNALLLKDPRMRQSSTANPDFIQQFYSESRLHHLSTWKAELKSRMQKLAADRGAQRKPPKRKPGARRYVMHVDFDSFFCAVSLKRAPDLVDKPTVVAHSSGNGSEIASCNYPARKYGVKNGMWMKKAKELCPELKVLPYDFPAYEEASRLFYESILEVGGAVQSVSIDEALVDVTSVICGATGSSGDETDEGVVQMEHEKADQIARALRGKIKERTGCAVSVGIGGNILLAKVALRKAKPAGQYLVTPQEVPDLLGPLKVDDLPGVAYSIAGKLEEIGVKFVGDIRQTSRERLTSVLGPKTGEKLWEYARGIDRTEVGDQPIRKSVSAEVNWGIRFINQGEAEEFVLNLCKELEKRLLNEQVKGKQLTMKIMRRSSDAPMDPPKHLGHGKCDTFNKSVMFGVSTHDGRILGKEAVSILRSFRFTPGDLRGLGVQLTKLEPDKHLNSGVQSSQKKLNFGAVRETSSAKTTGTDPIHDGVGSPDKYSPRQTSGKSADPIVEAPLTPRKPKPDNQHPAMLLAKAREKDSKASTPLNLGGTQFIMPTQPDPATIAELPHDIRTRLLAQGSAVLEKRDHSPAAVDGIPPNVDPEVFKALPDDVKDEILETYQRQRVPSRSSPSPRKVRTVQPATKVTPTKRRVLGLFAKGRERHADANARVKQTNFVPPNQQAEDAGLGDFEEIDIEFLAELPKSVRMELIADHRRKKAQRAGLDLKVNHRQHSDSDEEALLPGGQTKLNFAPRPAKIGFTSKGLTSLLEIRDMLSVWHQDAASEGPDKRDVEMFEKYLSRVVLEERDMDKAVKLVRWLGYLIEADESESPGKEMWQVALTGIKAKIQEAVRERGLGRVII